MSSVKYADSDFFLALMKDSDWLKENAKNIYENNKGNIYVSPFTIVELMIVCVREKIPVKKTLLQISRIAQTVYIKWDLFFKATEYIEQGASIFDSLLMAFVYESQLGSSEKNSIISSDKIYEKFGFKAIDLRKR